MSHLPDVVQRLRSAITDRDAGRIAGCFSEDYRNETPAHPARGFTGRAQVQRNWEALLGSVPDLTADVERWAVDGDNCWTEWRQTGTRLDGQSFELRGVVIFELRGAEIVAARFFLEPLDDSPDGIEAAVRRHAGPETTA